MGCPMEYGPCWRNFLCLQPIAPLQPEIRENDDSAALDTSYEIYKYIKDGATYDLLYKLNKSLSHA